MGHFVPYQTFGHDQTARIVALDSPTRMDGQKFVRWQSLALPWCFEPHDMGVLEYI